MDMGLVGVQISGGVHLENQCGEKSNGSTMKGQICRCKVLCLWRQSERALSQRHFALLLSVKGAVFAELWINQNGSLILEKDQEIK